MPKITSGGTSNVHLGIEPEGVEETGEVKEPEGVEESEGAPAEPVETEGAEVDNGADTGDDGPDEKADTPAVKASPEPKATAATPTPAASAPAAAPKAAAKKAAPAKAPAAAAPAAPAPKTDTDQAGRAGSVVVGGTDT